MSDHTYDTCAAKIHVENLIGWQHGQNNKLGSLVDAISEMNRDMSVARAAAVEAAKDARNACHSAERIAQKTEGLFIRFFWSVVGLGGTVIAGLIIAIATMR